MPRYNDFNYRKNYNHPKQKEDDFGYGRTTVFNYFDTPLYMCDQEWKKFDLHCQDILKYLDYVNYDGFTASEDWEEYIAKKNYTPPKYEEIKKGKSGSMYYTEVREIHKTESNELAVIQFSLSKNTIYSKNEASQPSDPPKFPPMLKKTDIPREIVPGQRYYYQYNLDESNREKDIEDRKLLWKLTDEINEKIQKKINDFEEIKTTFKRNYFIDRNDLKLSCEKFLLICFKRCNNLLPGFYQFDYQASYSQESKIIIVQFKFPDFDNINIIKHIKTLKDYSIKSTYFTETQKKKIIKTMLSSFLIRTAKISASFINKEFLDTIVVNIEQDWDDPATGNKRNGIIASLQASYDEISDLNLINLDPDACVRSLKGIVTPSMVNINPIQPMMVLDREDGKFVKTKGIDELSTTDENLATMPWEDFEHLVGQIIEREFIESGIEVRVTQASRDKGIDAVLFDPDPLKGGKFVIQAKRYTNTVDVSAVRDLHGTIMDQGANRGILITTSSYGTEAYKYIRGKPITLVDGSNLLKLLEKHGMKYRIDLKEAKIINKELNQK